MAKDNSIARKLIRLWARAILGLPLLISVGSYRSLMSQKISDEEYPSQEVFFPAESEIRANNSDPSRKSPEPYPSIGFRKFQHARVTANRRCAAVIQASQFLLPKASDEGPWNVVVGEPFTGGVIHQAGYKVFVNTAVSRSINKGVFVGSWSPHNWFHWTIDTLPSVWLASHLPNYYDDFPVLLPGKALEKAAWHEPLSLVLGNRDVERLPNDSYIAVEQLVWIDSPTCPGPLPLKKQPGRPNFRAHGSVLNAFRADILKALKIDESATKPTRRVFLARREGTHRPYNQEELIKVGKEFGFEQHYLEDLSFEDSIRLMLETSVLIGPHGAGWASALFCPNNITAIMWSWEAARDDNWFSNICQIRGIQMRVILDFETRGQNLWLNKDILRAQLGSLSN